MSRESDRSAETWREGNLGPSKVGVGSTRVPLCNRKGLGLFVAIVTALVWFADAGPLKEDARLWLVPGEPGRHTKSFAISADGTKIAMTDLDGAVAVREARSGWRSERLPSSPGYVGSVSLSPDARFLACAGIAFGRLDIRPEVLRGDAEAARASRSRPARRILARRSDPRGDDGPGWADHPLERGRGSRDPVVARPWSRSEPGLLIRRPPTGHGRSRPGFVDHPLGSRHGPATALAGG